MELTARRSVRHVLSNIYRNQESQTEKREDQEEREVTKRRSSGESIILKPFISLSGGANLKSPRHDDDDDEAPR